MPKRKNVTDRLEALERQAAAIRVGAVEASEFRLVDRTGQPRATLEMTRTGPRLAMMHEDGTVAIEIELTRDGPAIRLADSHGDTRVFIGAMRDTARIGMADETGAQRLFIGLSHGGDPSLTLYDDTQRQAWTTPTPKPRSAAKATKAARPRPSAK